jgi:hypothetical protein
MKTIVFWDNSLCERGTTIAVYDYAYYNQTMLNNRSIIMYDITSKSNHIDVIDKFTKHFKVIGVDHFDKVDEVLKEIGCDILYIIKGGHDDGRMSKVCKTVVHCVFSCNHPQGNVYAMVSPFIRGNNGRYPVVPHMINLPDNTNDMREQLNIPEDAAVFGRHGGFEQFDIKFVQDIVYKVASTHPNIYFLFLNTKPFCPELPNIIFIPRIVDLEKKVEFINTCDAMLWARSIGETYGLSIAEFSSKNKPVLCCDVGDNAHIGFLKEKAVLYNEETLEDLILGFDKEDAQSKDWNAFKDYTPEKVIQIFKQVFIDE